MNRVNWDGWFSLDLPDGWIHEDRPDVILIFHPDGAGALTISAARRKRRAKPTEDEATQLTRAFMESQDRTRIRVDVRKVDSYYVSKAEYKTDSEYWSVWTILDSKRAVTISYNSEPEDLEKERRQREAVIASFEWL